MANAIVELSTGLRAGRAKLGLRANGRGTPAQNVVDGDTVKVDLGGNLGIRLLGVDTPEKKSTLFDRQGFPATNSEAWQAYLADPFIAAPGYETELGPSLAAHLRPLVGEDAALNQHRHGQASEDELERLVTEDIATLGEDNESFEFFMFFAHEVMDGYGRLLCFLNRNQPDRNQPEPRPPSYNERLLEVGLAAPYFIWPNVNPFRRQRAVVNAVPAPDEIHRIARGAHELGAVREQVKRARAQGLGMFDPNDPLRLLPFELRFLGRRSVPSRWVIDLTAPDGALIPPWEYHRIPLPEDRLFVPAAYMPLFKQRGWQTAR